MINSQYSHQRRLLTVRTICVLLILLISMAPGVMTVTAQDSSLAVEIKANVNQAGPNEHLTFTVTVTNLKEEIRGGIDVIVRYDGNLIEQVSGQGGVLGETHEFVWSDVSLESRKASEYILEAVVRDPLPYGSSVLDLTVELRDEEKTVVTIKLTGLTLKGAILQLEEMSSDLSVDTNDNGKINPGDTIRIVIPFSNTGLGTSGEMTLTSYYPANLVAEVSNNINDGQMDEDAGTITWTQPYLEAGSSGQVEISLVLLGKGEFPPGVTRFTLRADIRSGEVIRNEVTSTVAVSVVSINLDMVCPFILDEDGDNKGDSDDQIKCSITLQNLGDIKAQAVNVVVTFDSDKIKVSEPSAPEEQNGMIRGDTITWENIEIDAGKELVLTFIGTILVVPEGQVSIPLGVTVEQEGEISTVIEKAIPLPEEEEISIIEILQPQQGTGALDGEDQKFLLLSFLGVVLAGMVGFLVLGIFGQRNGKPYNLKMGMVLEVFLLALTLFVVMFLGLQNAIDKEAINSIIGGIVGFVAGRAISSRDTGGQAG